MSKTLALALGLLMACQVQAAPETSMAPEPRPRSIAAEGTMVVAQARASNIGLQRWIDRFRARARRAGIRDRVFDAAFQGVRYNAGVVEKDRNQSEFTKQIWEYLDSAASDTRVKNGRAALKKNRRLLGEIEARYGVEAEVVAAVWGLESAYGTFRGETPLIEALATLAYDGRRGRFFEQQLIAALKIIQAGDVSPRRMTGSWAGAMGHTQFIPTSYLAYAVDFRGDGKRDIWSDDPPTRWPRRRLTLRGSGGRRANPGGWRSHCPGVSIIPRPASGSSAAPMPGRRLACATRREGGCRTTDGPRSYCLRGRRVPPS